MAAQYPKKSYEEKKTSEAQADISLEVANVKTEAADVNVVPASESQRDAEQDMSTVVQVEISNKNKLGSKAPCVTYTPITGIQEQETAEHGGPSEISEYAAASASQSVSEVMDLSQRSSRRESNCSQYQTQNRSITERNEPSTSKTHTSPMSIDFVDLTVESDDDSEDQRQVSTTVYEQSATRIRELWPWFFGKSKVRRRTWPWTPALQPLSEMLPFENIALFQMEPLNLAVTHTIDDANSDDSNDPDQFDPPI